MVGHLRHLLEQRGIPYHQRNVELGAGVGGLPPIECWPELWVEIDADALHALAVIASALHDPLEHLAAWTVMSVERVASRCRTALRVESGGVLFPCSFFACSRTISVQSGEQTTPIDHIEAILNQHSQERWELIQIEPPSLLIFKQSR